MLDVNGYNILEDFKRCQIPNQYPTNQDSKTSEEGLLICQAGQEGTVWDHHLASGWGLSDPDKDYDCTNGNLYFDSPMSCQKPRP